MSSPAAAIARLLGPIRWPLVALGLLLAVSAIVTPGLFAISIREGRLYGVPVDILNHGASVGIAAVGMTLVIATGGVDLSVGAVAAVAGALAAWLVAVVGAPWPAALVTAVGVSLVLGVWNGLLVAYLGLQPFVATLVLMVAGRGIAQLITGGLIITFENRPLAFIGNGSFLGLPFPAWILAALLVVTALATRRTSLGLFIEAVGDNPAASRLAGVNDRLVKTAVYGFCGLCAGLVGVIECSYIKAADANNAGQLLELDAILAVVIGGTSLRGGRYLLAGSMVGALLMQTLTRMLYMLDVPAEIAPAPKAIVVIVVCLIQSPEFRRRLAAIRPRGAA
jgi:ribose/xylose/arabinose/galactoside ABC-type transport system permease subunit